MDRMTKRVVVDSAEVATWNALIEGHYDRPSAWISNLLCFHHGVCRPPRTGGDGTPKMLPVVHAPAAPDPDLPRLSVRPNPADQWVVLDYDLGNGPENGALVVRDISGRELWRATIAAQRGQQVWDSRKVPAGTYSVSLLIAGHAAKTEVVIIAR